MSREVTESVMFSSPRKLEKELKIFQITKMTNVQPPNFKTGVSFLIQRTK